MTVALLVMTDGRRDCIARTVPEFLDKFDRPDLLSELLIHDDSGDPDYGRWLAEEFGPRGFVIMHAPGRSGFGGAIRSAWQYLRDYSRARFVFHLEDDFVPRRTVPLAEMVAVLEDEPELVQLALRRQPWNEHERAAGGIVEQHPDAYSDEIDGAGHRWLEHRLFFTTNPGLYRIELLEEEWPRGPQSEGRFSHDLLRGDDRRRFGFYGSRDSGEWVEHIGAQRVGTGY
jgi:hypothetical protein